ncbi:hypothetical protein VTI74DRAFT_2840 [Chaetomium olivicolor]
MRWSALGARGAGLMERPWWSALLASLASKAGLQRRAGAQTSSKVWGHCLASVGLFASTRAHLSRLFPRPGSHGSVYTTSLLEQLPAGTAIRFEVSLMKGWQRVVDTIHNGYAIESRQGGITHARALMDVGYPESLTPYPSVRALAFSIKTSS